MNKQMTFKRITFGKKIKLLDRKEENTLFEKIKQKGNNGRNIIIEANVGLVISIAKKYIGGGIELDDLIQIGFLGLIDAIDRFDPKRKIKFSTYASYWIKARIIRKIEEGGIIKLPHMAYFSRVQALRKIGKNLSVDDYINTGIGIWDIQIQTEQIDQQVFAERLGEKSPNPIAQVEAKIDIERFLGILSERQRRIVELYYGINTQKPLTFREIGKEMNVTRQAIEQGYKGSIQKMKKFALADNTNLALGARE